MIGRDAELSVLAKLSLALCSLASSSGELRSQDGQRLRHDWWPGDGIIGSCRLGEGEIKAEGDGRTEALLCPGPGTAQYG